MICDQDNDEYAVVAGTFMSNVLPKGMINTGKLGDSIQFSLLEHFTSTEIKIHRKVIS